MQILIKISTSIVTCNVLYRCLHSFQRSQSIAILFYRNEKKHNIEPVNAPDETISCNRASSSSRRKFSNSVLQDERLEGAGVLHNAASASLQRDPRASIEKDFLRARVYTKTRRGWVSARRRVVGSMRDADRVIEFHADGSPSFLLATSVARHEN